ncbi:MAG: DUF2325 domain-containing protein [Deltaproteobacteria bacterium]|nr:DUF2325 domain-containing protein [Deltaproteobacteria bacterium]
MRIGIVGGVERTEQVYRRVAEEAGHELAFHGGHVAGRGADKLVELVRTVDVVVVLTDINSHGAVGVARKAAARSGTPVLLHRRLGPSRFAAELPQLEAVAAAAPGRRVA